LMIIRKGFDYFEAASLDLHIHAMSWQQIHILQFVSNVSLLNFKTEDLSNIQQ